MTELTIEEKQKRLEEAKQTTEYILKESSRREWAQAKDTTINVWNNLQRIEQKERCIRVKFLDWLSDKLLAWGQKVHEMSVKIDSPCVIKLPEKKENKK
jgi:hypothetical protein